MNNSANFTETRRSAVAKLPLAAAFVALLGLADSIYLTYEHYTGGTVPCSIVAGCEQVLTSSYAAVAGVPLAIFGAAAYFAAFLLAITAAFGNRRTWNLFGVQVILMAAFSVWLIYVQAYIIEAFCQFCLLSAATTLTLLLLFCVSRFGRFR